MKNDLLILVFTVFNRGKLDRKLSCRKYKKLKTVVKIKTRNVITIPDW